MFLSKISILNFRNLNLVQHLSFVKKINIFFGDNGSGKTNFLESIYYLFLGKSFRTRDFKNLITSGHQKFILNAFFDDKCLGAERSSSNDTVIRLNQNNISILNLVKIVPIQFFNLADHEILQSGPNVRRKFLDWGLFHVEQIQQEIFLNAWRELNILLKQRNSVLKDFHFLLKKNIKSKLDFNLIKAWNYKIEKNSEIINTLRIDYIKKLKAKFNEYLFLAEKAEVLPSNFSSNFNIKFYSGWNNENTKLSDILEKNIFKDIQLRYTQYGAHRFDIQFLIDNYLVQDFLSQGQQKLLIYLLKISQAELFINETNKKPIFLIDELSAELDSNKVEFICKIFSDLNVQVFITDLTRSECHKYFLSNNFSVFHVKHGNIDEIKYL